MYVGVCVGGGGWISNILPYCITANVILGKNEILFQKVKIQKITKGEVERKMVLVQPKARDVKEKAD